MDDFGVVVEEFDPRLLMAARKGDAVLVAELIAGGAKTRSARNGITTPLMEAARWGKSDCVKLLLGGSDIDAKDEGGATALMLCESRCRKNSLPESERGACTQLLLGASADVSAVDDSKWTAMHHASFCDISGQAIQALKRAGADPDAGDEMGSTPLMIGLFNDSFDAVKTIMPMSDLARVDSMGRTAAMVAKENRLNELAKMLEAASPPVPDLAGKFAKSAAEPSVVVVSEKKAAP